MPVPSVAPVTAADGKACLNVTGGQSVNIYLAIITTVLVLTQIVRVTQNAIQLRRQEKQIQKTLSWFNDNDVSEQDFIVQRQCFYLLRDWLEEQVLKKNGSE